LLTSDFEFCVEIFRHAYSPPPLGDIKVLTVTGVPKPSLYINREGCGAVTILVGSKEGVLNQTQKLLSIGIQLVWPILLGFGVVDATPLLALVCGPSQDP
jgi:hypothetical protein